MPIVNAVIKNPFNLKDFQEDKLLVLDIKAVDGGGALFSNVEVQLEALGAVQRIAFYGCEMFAGQLQAGQGYETLRPVYGIWLIDDILWPEATAVHHTFRLTDKDSGRVLEDTLEIHTLELARYNVKESELSTASELDCWLFWSSARHEYEPEVLAKLLPQPAIRQATDVLSRIAQDHRGQSHVRCTRKGPSRPEMGNRHRQGGRQDQRRDQRQDQRQDQAGTNASGIARGAGTS